ncbi:hypothetical protein Metev_1873 [Methanohalobium evestigatum Z-7303]|uniref:Uncharacterized protein n=1 Tax=Methanohalobium evestigatum (strain ATCC BAA-1072 / DSM 3721 / NBRC 107634 / OCM 161 / Z-7303) TaxID=644295 RepID=D7EA35_METEZ|nr:hypothetical protein Metev_1873 [Methanohalobium evestigatum Z-7303]
MIMVVVSPSNSIEGLTCTDPILTRNGLISGVSSKSELSISYIYSILYK